MATATLPATETVEQLLGDEASSLLEHQCETVSNTMLHLPGPDFIDRVWTGTDRSNRVLRNLSSIYAGPLVLFLACPLAVLFPLCEWR